MSLKPDLDYAIELARGAAKIVLDHYGKVERLTKTHIAANQEAVTDADRASQRFIVKGLRDRFPTDGIIGEESDSGDSITCECPDPAGRVWVIDPIDGTNNFVGKFGNFAVCIGLLDKGMPVLGVVLDVTRNWVYAASKGSGATLNGNPIHALDTPLADSSMLMLTSNLLIKGKLPNWAPKWIAQTTWKIRMMGSAAIEAVQVAAGIAHGAVTVNGKLWDAVAPAAIVIESGGIITDLGGNPVFPFDLRNYQGAKVPFIAAGRAAHATIAAEIANHP
jgi:myo-inositol-1(or 4)-monophosphatase